MTFRAPGRGSPVDFGGQATKVQEELSHEDRMALAQMEESKAEQDKLLDEIGVVVGNLGVLATGIGEVRSLVPLGRLSPAPG